MYIGNAKPQIQVPGGRLGLVHQTRILLGRAGFGSAGAHGEDFLTTWAAAGRLGDDSDYENIWF